MRNAAFLLGLLLVVAPACAETEQEKVKACSAEASKQDLTANKHQAFMKQCLANSDTPAGEKKKKPTPQQIKMKKCNADAKAKELKGDVRKKFMSTCLKAG